MHMCIKVHYILLIGVIIVIPSSEEGYITETDCLQKQEKTEMTKWPNSFPSQQQLLPFHMLHKNPDFFFFFLLHFYFCKPSRFWFTMLFLMVVSVCIS